MHPSPDPLATHVLLARAQDGDERALRLLYDRYLERLRRWAHGQVNARARTVYDTNVVAHDVLTKVLLKIPELRQAHEMSFRSYVITALRNTLISVNRTAAAEHVDLDTIAEQVVDLEPTPMERTIYQGLEQAMVRAFNRLDEKHQRVIVLRRIEGRSHRDVAAAMGYDSENAARVACARAYASLKSEVLAIDGPAA